MPATAETSQEQSQLALSPERLGEYLSLVLGEPLSVEEIRSLGEPPGGKSIKGFGYGTPLKIECRGLHGTRCFVLETVAPGPFGHQGMADRAQILLASHAAFNKLPRHVKSLDAGAFLSDGRLLSVGGSEEFFLLMEFVEGSEYSWDLTRIRERGEMNAEDPKRCDALADYLVGIHERKGDAEDLYVRRLRELVGHSECLLGLSDSYLPGDPVFSPVLLRRIEKLCLDWRWRLKDKTYRLCQVHGDFHPWNILFQPDGEFRILDRSRGEWGEAADDLVALSINYVFFALQNRGRVEGPLLELHDRFWQRYLDWTGDYEVLQCVAPFLAFRGLVLGSPLWYPDSSRELREALRNLILNLLQSREFDPGRIRDYCEES